MDKLTEAINNASKDNKIGCKDALKISQDLNIAPIKVGNECDRIKIKIQHCQLGCFK